MFLEAAVGVRLSEVCTLVRIEPLHLNCYPISAAWNPTLESIPPIKRMIGDHQASKAGAK